MQKLSINRQIVEVNKNEGKEVQRIKALLEEKPNSAQRAADNWILGTPDEKAKERRRAVIRALELTVNH